MPETAVQEVDRGTGAPAALADALTRGEYDELPVRVDPGVRGVWEKIRAALFSEREAGVVVCLELRSSELTEEYVGEAIYTDTYGVMASAPSTGTNEVDAGRRLIQHLSGAVRADPNLAGTCIHARLAEADVEVGAQTDRIVVNCEVDVVYSTSR